MLDDGSSTKRLTPFCPYVIPKSGLIKYPNSINPNPRCSSSGSSLLTVNSCRCFNEGDSNCAPIETAEDLARGLSKRLPSPVKGVVNIQTYSVNPAISAAVMPAFSPASQIACQDCGSMGIPSARRAAFEARSGSPGSRTWSKPCAGSALRA